MVEKFYSSSFSGWKCHICTGMHAAIATCHPRFKWSAGVQVLLNRALWPAAGSRFRRGGSVLPRGGLSGAGERAMRAEVRSSEWSDGQHSEIQPWSLFTLDIYSLQCLSNLSHDYTWLSPDIRGRQVNLFWFCCRKTLLLYQGRSLNDMEFASGQTLVKRIILRTPFFFFFLNPILYNLWKGHSLKSWEIY